MRAIRVEITEPCPYVRPLILPSFLQRTKVVLCGYRKEGFWEDGRRARPCADERSYRETVSQFTSPCTIIEAPIQLVF